MSGEGRAPGWYPDPWGTPEERYFDGVAWARTTRRPGGLGRTARPARAGPADARRVEAPSMARRQPPSATPASAAPGAPPGWHPDPWAAAALRYWDGSQWTGHVSGMPGGPPPTLRLAEERTAARWAKAGLAWAGPALGVSSIAGAFQWQLDRGPLGRRSRHRGASRPTATRVRRSSASSPGSSLLVAGVLFLIWFHRSAVLAASAGLSRAPQARCSRPISFFIPILNFWWPYQSTCDLLPANHPARVVVRRWWVLWIACSVGGITIIATAFMNVIALGDHDRRRRSCWRCSSAVAARNVVSEISDAHDQLLAGV